LLICHSCYPFEGQVSRILYLVSLILSLPSVEFLVDLAEVFVRDVGINLGRGDGGVTEHCLDASDVGAVLEEIGRERVAQGVRVDVLHDTRLRGGAFHNALDGAFGDAEPLAATALFPLTFFRDGDEECRVHVGAFLEVAPDRIPGVVGEKDDPEFRSFPANGKLAFFQVYLVAIKRGEFGDPEPGREEELEHGAVASPAEAAVAGSKEELLHLAPFEEIDLPIRRLADLDLLGWDAFDVLFREELEERAQDDDVEVLRAFPERLTATVVGAVHPNPVRTDFFEGNFLWSLYISPGEELRKHSVITLDRFRGARKLDFEVLEKSGGKFLDRSVVFHICKTYTFEIYSYFCHCEGVAPVAIQENDSNTGLPRFARNDHAFDRVNSHTTFSIIHGNRIPCFSVSYGTLLFALYEHKNGFTP